MTTPLEGVPGVSKISELYIERHIDQTSHLIQIIIKVITNMINLHYWP